jgi:hypothetical protein
MRAKGVVMCGELLFCCDHLARAPSMRICPEMAQGCSADSAQILLEMVKKLTYR